jgi:alkylation response protein AidB-like acyl-CoA dehydrogenase
MKVVTDAVQVFGANGFSREYPVERLYREAKVLEIIEGTSQILQPIIAQYAINAYH